MKVVFTLKDTTKGSLRYQEVDAAGNEVDYKSASVGALYIRKTSEIGQAHPNKITVTIEAS